MKKISFFRFIKYVIFAFSTFLILSLFFVYFVIPKVVDVNDITKNPESFKGNVGVVGEVWKTITKKGGYETFIILDCRKKRVCGALPVAYKGEKPEVGSKIIAYGKIEEYKGEYSFINNLKAHKINASNNDLKGNIFYFMRMTASREGIILFRKWLYAKCKKCYKLKKKIIPFPLFGDLK